MPSIDDEKKDEEEGGWNLLSQKHPRFLVATAVAISQSCAWQPSPMTLVFAQEQSRFVPPGCQSTACEFFLDPGALVIPAGIAIDGAGNICLIDQEKRRVLKLPAGCTSGACALPVGSGFIDPVGIALDSAGNVFISDLNFYDESGVDASDRVVVVNAESGAQTTIIDSDKVAGIAVDAAGDVIMSDLSSGAIEDWSAEFGALVISLAGPGGYSALALDSAGNVFL